LFFLGQQGAVGWGDDYADFADGELGVIAAVYCSAPDLSQDVATIVEEPALQAG
jgi:hypothetical protein